VAALAGDLDGVLVFFAVGAAVFFGGHAGTGRVGAFFRIGHGVLLGRPIDPTAMLVRGSGGKVAVLISAGKTLGRFNFAGERWWVLREEIRNWDWFCPSSQ
jgi:hypothetical protein